MTDEDGATPAADDLAPPVSAPVRERVVSLTAAALGRMPAEQLPVALRKVASFAPNRRARLAGAQIWSVLQSDDAFRARVAVQVQASLGEVGDGGAGPGDPVAAAAVAWLLRSPGWQSLVEAPEPAQPSDTPHEAGPVDRDAERLRRRLATADAELRRLKDTQREQGERVKAQHGDLRRKLGDTRARLRAAEADVERLQAERAEQAASAERAAAAGEAEVRRLRARVGQLEDELAGARRSERAAKVDETVRVKLLVDTLVQAAQGLQRELGLPAVTRLPADTVVAAEPEEGSRVSSGRGSLAGDDPELLEQLLRLPRAHLVVDGYNVTKHAWPELSLEQQRERLLSGVAALRSRIPAEVTVVFDAAETRNRPLVAAPRGVRVRFSPFGVIADDVIRDLVAAEPAGRAVVVVSSDQEVVGHVEAAGFRAIASAGLAALLSRG